MLILIIDTNLQQRLAANSDCIYQLGHFFPERKPTNSDLLEESILERVVNELIPIDLVEVNFVFHERWIVCLDLIDEVQELVGTNIDQTETQLDLEIFFLLRVVLQIRNILVLRNTLLINLLLGDQDVSGKFLQTLLVELVLQSLVNSQSIGDSWDLELNPAEV